MSYLLDTNIVTFILIAATAIARGLILVSHDSDLLQVQGLNLENWAKLESGIIAADS